jgi:hypothetical protein
MGSAMGGLGGNCRGCSERELALPRPARHPDPRTRPAARHRPQVGAAAGVPPVQPLDADVEALAQALLDAKRGLDRCPPASTSRPRTRPCAPCARTRAATPRWCASSSSPPTCSRSSARAQYQGRYHVLHGVLSPMHGVGPDELTLRGCGRASRGRGGGARDLDHRRGRGHRDVPRAEPAREGRPHQPDRLRTARRRRPRVRRRGHLGAPSPTDARLRPAIRTPRPLDGAESSL